MLVYKKAYRRAFFVMLVSKKPDKSVGGFHNEKGVVGGYIPYFRTPGHNYYLDTLSQPNLPHYS